LNAAAIDHPSIARCPWYRVQPTMRTATGHVVVSVQLHADGSGRAWGYRDNGGPMTLSLLSVRAAPDLDHPGTVALLLDEAGRRWRCPSMYLRPGRDMGWTIEAPGLRHDRLRSVWGPTRAAAVACLYLIPPPA
jgi:hypothetical protein